MSSLTEADRVGIETAVKTEFGRLVDAINRKDIAAWSGFYSTDRFASAIAGTEFHATRAAWVAAVTAYFEARAGQHVDVEEVRVTPLAPDLALMTSREKSEMRMKDGTQVRSRHVYTLLWHREAGGWKIVHSHESWTDESAK